MSGPTTESVNKQIDRFIDHFNVFEARLTPRHDMYLPLSDKIALFAIYWNQAD